MPFMNNNATLHSQTIALPIHIFSNDEDENKIYATIKDWGGGGLHTS